MPYSLTPEQRAGINAADEACRAAGIPTYYDAIQALAGLVVAVRDGKPTVRAMNRGAAVLEQLRNESAPPVAVNAQRLQAAQERLGA
jgi:hypothetical protein